jgi:hypothetical protein
MTPGARPPRLSYSEAQVVNEIIGEHTLAIAALESAFKKRKEDMKLLRKTARKWGFVGGLLGGLAGAGVHLLGGCGAGTPQPADLAAYERAQMACVDDNDARATIDDCRAATRAKWCARFPSEVNCDGGPEQ